MMHTKLQIEIDKGFRTKKETLEVLERLIREVNEISNGEDGIIMEPDFNIHVETVDGKA